MNDNSIDTIRENNKIINELINSINNMRKEYDISIDDGAKMEPIARQIFELKLKVTMAIYQAEYSQYGFSECRGKQEVNLKDKRLDCTGGDSGLKVGKNLNQDLTEGVFPKLKGKLSKSGNIVTPNYSGSERDQLDFYNYLKKIGGNDIDFVMAIIEHEAKHIYGVIGGNDFLKEGITEQTTREDCDKYGMHMSPTSHTQEANLIRKLEAIIGRDVIVRTGLYDKHVNMKKEAFQKIIDTPEYSSVKPDELEEIFEMVREDKISGDKKDNFEKFKNNYPELILDLKEIRNKYDRMNNKERYEEFDRALQDKIPNINSKKLRQTLANIYKIQTMKGHKTDPIFYRKLYSENWNKFLSDEDWKILIGRDDIEQSELSRIKEEGIDLLGTGKKIKSFTELTEPINEYIRENNIDLNKEEKSPKVEDYHEVVNKQRSAILQLQRLKEHLKNMIFHDQKSDKFFEDRTTGKYSVLEPVLTKKSLSSFGRQKEVAVENQNVDEIIEQIERKEEKQNGEQVLE